MSSESAPRRPVRGRFRRCGRLLGAGVGLLLFYLLTLWCAGVLYFNKLLPGAGLRFALAAVVALALGSVPLLLALAPRRWRWPILAGAGALLLAVVSFNLLLSPRLDRDWSDSCARLPECELSGSRLRVKNLRDFDYRSEQEFTVRYQEREYDLERITGLDLALSHWGGNRLIAHSMLSFRFAEQPPLVVSVECRYERGDGYSTVAGLFKNFESIMIFGTETDLFRLRTNFRHEQLYLYPTNFTPEESKRVLLDLVRRAGELRVRPQFYHTLNYNCSTALASSLLAAHPGLKFDLRLLLNGLADWMAFSRGWLADVRPNENFLDYRLRHWTNQWVEHLADPAGYSRLVRSAFGPYSSGSPTVK